MIAKLMAKDRDRRYQTPEHLVRDLLGVAGSIGLTPPSFSFPAWQAEGTRHAWERNLVWLVPVAAARRRGSGLAWWGRDLARTSSRLAATGRVRPPRAARATWRVIRALHHPGRQPERPSGPSNEAASPATGLLSQYPGQLQ